jgi:2-hydroxychromene-2-carboxylate isomerase
MRLRAVENESGVAFRWRPFSVRANRKTFPSWASPSSWRTCGATSSGERERAASSRDCLRRIRSRNFHLANRIAIVREGEGWCGDYVRAVYRHWYHSGREPGSEPGLSDALREIGQSPASVVEAAKSDEIGERYKAAAEEAKSIGVFGSPTFVVDGEVFWGDDRLEDAIRWRQNSRAWLGL